MNDLFTDPDLLAAALEFATSLIDLAREAAPYIGTIVFAKILGKKDTPAAPKDQGRE